MDEAEEVYCIGCGAKIQTTEKDGTGYTPQGALDKGLEKGEVYCQRCFRLRHYNEIAPVSLTDDDFLRLLSQIRDDDALIVYVVDMFDFNGSMIPGIHRFVGDNPILLVGNKDDVFPKSMKRSRMKEWLKQQANAQGIRPIDVLLTSAKKPDEIETLLNTIEKYRKKRNAYVVGVTNVGKSTLINQIIRLNNGTQDLITTSRFPGTTLDKIEIPFADGKMLIDTPGIVHEDQMAHVLTGKDLKYVSPQKTIKPKTFQLSDQQTLFFGGIARFDYLRGHGAVSTYFENNLMVHRTKLANADEFYDNHVGTYLTPPDEDGLEKLPDLQRHELHLENRSDVVVEGLGWITVPEHSTVAVWAPKGISVVIRKPLV
ncbi:ribosome biogenesis GTPase YqeH [Pediococcus inopinatus]|uniref:Ribosome biogenesis GTPase YqeH n=1 Tax=Pediococcus inopinatus TaxID=114090 RepID=A0ABZ0Q6Y6_9LACO|nr:ribosome biogenesis GTPase YqeH [Pediococcus inopinatus]WPC17482.1 ribosome biogenesis GTPase YqeH [Pediococcus inopinatus]WPC18852.1 ribosome biogenesis GTPase YqeH [Pediococcus inopinatus]WPC22469.1 ribosome biogenesis GTPase YqeH [Pediococcus inopinatus]WPP08598.1 ribosome biogenesis GTPase YqeH [Pediococcus inopinatus]